MARSCKQASQLLSQQMEHPLPWRERLRLNVHLAMCKNCQRAGFQFGFLRSACREYMQGADDSGQQDRS